MHAKKIAVIFAFSFLLVNSAYGVTRYVDGNLSFNCTSGNYSIANRACNGSNGNAYKTVTAGIGAMSLGDTVNIRSGTYTENSIVINFGSATTTIQAYQNESVTIHNSYLPTKNDDGKYTFFLNSGTGEIIFKNFKLTGVKGAVDEDYAAVGIMTQSDMTGRVTIDNCEFNGFAHCGIKGSARFWIKNCYFHDIGTDDNDHHIYSTGQHSTGNEAIIEYNRFGSVPGAAIHIYTGSAPYPSYHIIRYNIMYAAHWGIVLGGGYCKIYNNTIYGSDSGLWFYKAGCQNNDIKNNIFYGNNSDLWIDSPGTNNVCSGNYLGSSAACTGCSGSFNYIDDAPPNIRNRTNPFISGSPSTWTDFRLSSSSAAINAGTNLGTAHQNGLDPNNTVWPPSTLNQNSQGAGWEIGAFVFRESGSDTTPPSAPQNLGIIKN